MNTFQAALVCTPLQVFAPGWLTIDGETIVSAGPPGTAPSGVLHAYPDSIILPGFVDSHIHGGNGADVMDDDPDALHVVAAHLAKFGTTSFLPTTVSASIATLDAALPRLAHRMDVSRSGARPRGIHMEGPFLSPGLRGTHPEDRLVRPDIDLFMRWLRLSEGAIRLITVAPELPGAGELIQAARRAGVHVAIGHSNATFDESTKAIDAGVRCGVHTFNAMRPLHHREPGIAGAVLTDDRVFAEMIADAVHVDPRIVKLFARTKGPDRTLWITDAVAACGMPDGSYAVGGIPVEVIAGVCRNLDGQLAGSTLTQDRALRHVIEWTGWSLAEAVRGMTVNPARLLGLDNVGELAPGRQADFIIMDPSLHVRQTWVGGQLAFDRGKDNG